MRAFLSGISYPNKMNLISITENPMYVKKSIRIERIIYTYYFFASIPPQREKNDQNNPSQYHQLGQKKLREYWGTLDMTVEEGIELFGNAMHC
jgi:hypothetical protein